RLVLDHDGLAPFGRELVGDHARSDVDARPRAERHDEAHAARRPLGCGLRLRGWKAERRQGAEREKQAAPVHKFPPEVFLSPLRWEFSRVRAPGLWRAMSRSDHVCAANSAAG